MRKTVIETATGEVTNVIVIAEGSDWTPPEGQTLGPDGGQIGQRWTGSEYEWIDPPQTEDV